MDIQKFLDKMDKHCNEEWEKVEKDLSKTPNKFPKSDLIKEYYDAIESSWKMGYNQGYTKMAYLMIKVLEDLKTDPA